MKDFLKKIIKAKEARAAELRKQIQDSQSADEVRALGATLDTVLTELQEAKDQLAELDQQGEGNGEGGEGGEGRGFNPLASYGMNGAQPPVARDADPRATMEYRAAFMDFVRTGTRAPVLGEARSDDQTELSNLGVLIPTTVVQEIIKGVEKVYGQLYSRVKKTNIKGGVKYPIGSFSATFNRIGENGAPTDRQDGGSITGYVEFGYLIGEIRLAQTLLMSVMDVTVFEAELANVIVETYVKAMDNEIMNGVPASNQCAGILTEAKKSSGSRIAAGNIITFSADDMKDWTAWQKKLFAKIPLSMRGLNPEFVMTNGTWEANILTLSDSNGQPVAREIFNPVDGAETARFKGKEVVFVEEDILKSFDDASANDYFGMYWVPEKAYAINTNLQFAVKRYFDEEKNQWVQKALVINDGKILDPKYIYLLKKGS